MTAKRPLGVPAGDPERPTPAARPAWHRVGIGTIALLLSWIPMSVGAGWAARRVVAAYVPEGDAAATRAAIVALPPSTRAWLLALVACSSLCALALAAMLAGVLVGRLGADGARRDAALAGALGAGLAALVFGWPVVANQGVPSLLATTALVVAIAAGASAAGAMLDRRWRG